MEIKLFSKWRPSAILNLRKLHFWSRVLYWHLIKYFQSKFRINRSIWRRDIVKKRFSIWRPSAILNLRKLQYWSCDLYQHVILHLCSKFRVDRPIWHRDIAQKNDFQYGVRPPSWICYDVIILYRKNAFTFPTLC